MPDTLFAVNLTHVTALDAKLTSCGAPSFGKALLTKCIHPEVIGVAGCFGRKSEGLKLSRGKGIHFNSFLPHRLDRIDSLSASLDSCVRVKVSKV